MNPLQNTISNFHSSLYILFDVSERLERLFFIFKQYPPTGLESFHFFTTNLRNYMIMETASFMDEYEHNFLEINDRHPPDQLKHGNRPILRIEQQYWPRIADLDKTIQPIMDTLKRWTEIRKFRKYFVAHGSRTDLKHGHHLIISGQEPYDAPRKFFEFQLLHDLVHIIFGLIAQEFKHELNDAFFQADTLKAVMNPLKDNSKIQNELEMMINKFNLECQQQGKNYSLNLPAIEYPELKDMVKEMEEYKHPLTYMNFFHRNNYNAILEDIKKGFEETKKDAE